MIAFIRGTVAEKNPDGLVVQVGGIGFEVRAPAGTIDRAPSVGREVSLFTYLLVRQDAMQLYGFDSSRARDLFVKLMSVSGFGSAKALQVLSVFSPEGFEEVIRDGDADRLTMIPGVGKKGAQRLLLEMRDRLELFPQELTGIPEFRRRAFDEATEALVQLGYTRHEALGVLRRYPFSEGEGTVEELLQWSLRNMGGDA